MSQPGDGTKPASSARPARAGIGTKETWLSVGGIALWILLWEMSIQTALLDPRFFRPPSAFALTFLNLVVSGEMWRQLSATLHRLLVGYWLGAIPALLLAFLMTRNRWLRAGCAPLSVCLGAFPATALIPLLWMALGGDHFDDLARQIMVATAVFFPVLYCARTGMENDKPRGDAVPVSRGTHSWETESRSQSGVVTRWAFLGLKLGTGTGFLTLIAAEMLLSRVGLGYLIWQSWLTFSVETMYVGITVTGVVGAIFWLVLRIVEKQLSARLSRPERIR